MQKIIPIDKLKSAIYKIHYNFAMEQEAYFFMSPPPGVSGQGWLDQGGGGSLSSKKLALS